MRTLIGKLVAGAASAAVTIAAVAGPASAASNSRYVTDPLGDHSVWSGTTVTPKRSIDITRLTVVVTDTRLIARVKVVQVGTNSSKEYQHVKVPIKNGAGKRVGYFSYNGYYKVAQYVRGTKSCKVAFAQDTTRDVFRFSLPRSSACLPSAGYYRGSAETQLANSSGMKAADATAYTKNVPAP